MDTQEVRDCYRRVFMSDNGKVVLTDLAEYCNFLSSTDNILEEAKRDVFLYILDMYDVAISEVISAIQKIPAQQKKEQGKTDNG